ncbi:MAG: B12-binding domain-containing radical SAM protein, partial [Planctomycetota bacterium]
MSKIAFINPPWYFENKKAIILSQNLGLGYLSSYLEKHGHRATIIDALAEGKDICKKISTSYQEFLQVGLPYQDILERIPLDSDFIGITAPFTNHARIVRELSLFIKKRLKNIPIILGGPCPSLMPEKALSEGVDYCVVGEGEVPLLEIMSGKDPRHINGTRIHSTKDAPSSFADRIDNLDEVPFPARDKLPMDMYFGSYTGRGRINSKTAGLITSRGCPYDCAFCAMHALNGYKWRARSPENVVGEIEFLKKTYGVEHIEIEDDNMTLDKQRAIAICERIKTLNKKTKIISWSTPNGIRTDTLDEKLLIKIKNAN